LILATAGTSCLYPASLHRESSHPVPRIPFSFSIPHDYCCEGSMCRANRVRCKCREFSTRDTAVSNATTCLTYRSTACAPMAGSMQMGSRVHAPAGGISPPPLVSSLTGSGLRSLFLGYRDTAGGRFWAALAQLVTLGKGRRHEIGRRLGRICEIKGTWGDVSIAPS
jgi:hypothetical protein